MSDLTITLEGSEVRADFFGTNAWLRNDGTSTIYAGRKPGVVSGAAGVVSVPAGGSAPVFDAHGTVYIIGTGSVQLIGSDYSNNPFKSSAQGGSGADEVARAAIEAHAGNSAIHLTAEQINGVDGGKTVEKSASYTLDNAVDYPLIDLRLYGKSTQDGVPTPDAPVDIVSVGDSGAVSVTACGKNLYEGSQDWSGTWEKYSHWEDDNQTYLGLSVKKSLKQWNGLYKSIFAEKGKTYAFSFYAKSNVEISAKVFIVSQNEVGQIPQTALPSKEMSITVSSEWKWYSLTYACEKSGYVRPRVEKTTADDNYLYVCGYQLEVGDTATPYEPYVGSTANLTSALPLCGIPVSEGGNYTDSNGQRWICDELVYNADGTGKIVKRTNEINLNGSSDEMWSLGTTETSSTDNTHRFFVELTGNLSPIVDAGKYTIYTPSMCLCDKYKVLSPEQTWTKKIGICAYHHSTTSRGLCIFDETHATSTIDEWKSYLASNPVTVVYALNTPQELDLTAEEMTALKALQTFDGVTNISNNGGAEMQIKYCTNKALSEYVKPIKTGLQKQIDELKTAVLSLGGNV